MGEHLWMQLTVKLTLMTSWLEEAFSHYTLQALRKSTQDGNLPAWHNQVLPIIFSHVTTRNDETISFGLDDFKGSATY